MKTIGLIGGMSWESSKVYYELINKKVKQELGGFHSCKCIMYSVDFAEIEHLQHHNKWIELNQIMVNAALRLEKAGADIIVLCTNTMHVSSESIETSISIPFLHIAEATGNRISELKIKKVGLLGTKFTMEMDFYKSILNDTFGIEVIIPDQKSRQLVHNIIYEELVHGKIKDTSRKAFKSIIDTLEKNGAQGVILGCTEIPMLISDSDVNVPTFDTTEIHCEHAVKWALPEH